MSELLKLPQLVEHFYDHKSENKSTNLASFLVMHYYQENGTDKDANEDSQLPFKSIGIASTVSFISVAPPQFTVTLIQPPVEGTATFGRYKALFLPSQYLAAIWQPPRNA